MNEKYDFENIPRIENSDCVYISRGTSPVISRDQMSTHLL